LFCWKKTRIWLAERVVVITQPQGPEFLVKIIADFSKIDYPKLSKHSKNFRKQALKAACQIALSGVWSRSHRCLLKERFGEHLEQFATNENPVPFVCKQEKSLKNELEVCFQRITEPQTSSCTFGSNFIINSVQPHGGLRISAPMDLPGP